MAQLLLLEKQHLDFDTWFIRQLRQDLLPEGFFRIIDLRVDYLALCWKEEELWKKWSENAKE